ncbi:MAG: hypothetical protein CSB13_11300 [Chloroflexi bacterium]|nr:MAG: hypothetical protein CSB13_11300 [Chloroflexota bacterium]
MIKRFALLIMLPVLLLMVIFVGKRPFSTQAAPTAVQAPVLKWQNAGCYSSWCETGWYASPAVADIDNDGDKEVIASHYSIVSLDGDTGAVEWRVKSGSDRSDGLSPGNVGRTWPGIVIADLDNNGDLEIVTAHGGGWVSVYNHQGYFEPGWPQKAASQELRGLSVYDLDNNDDLEIIVTAASYNDINTWVYEHNGSLRGGWPQLNNDSGYAHGVFNDNATVGDIDNDGTAEIVVPSDVHYIAAYESNGVQIQANAIYGSKKWGAVGVHVDHAVDLRGWAHCGTEHRPNFAHTPAAIVDVNGDGVNEVVAMGNVYNCGTSPYTSLYEIPFIFNGDRSRWAGNSFDWEVIPSPAANADPISEDYNTIESNMSNPVVADLDSDGFMEILFSSYDGRLHAFWLDKQQKHNWPYDVYQPAEGFYRFASEPVIADLDNDGYAEVIFTSWTQKGSNHTGKLHILDYQGNQLHALDLPTAYDGHNWNGALAAPTLDNIDDDADLEVVINTAHSGFVAYDLPGTENARVLWGTGRNNYQRSASYLNGNLERSHISAVPLFPAANDTVRYTIHLDNPGLEITTASIVNAIPANVTYAHNLDASSGTAEYGAGTVTWTGTVPKGSVVTVSYDVTVNPSVTTPTPIVNAATINDGLGNTLERSLTLIANGEVVHLPIVTR